MDFERIQNNTSGETPDDENEDYTAEILSNIQMQEEYEHAVLMHAIEEARSKGKEDFDPAAFANKYWRQGMMRNGMENAMDDSVVESYIKQYYLDNPDVMTIDDFVRRLEKHDSELE